MSVGELVELPLGLGRVLHFQVFEEHLRISSRHRIERAVTPAWGMGGSISIPLADVKKVSETLRLAATKKPVVR